ncbi:MAG: guanylate kinase [Lachnospiraceae bacterium]|nr:guanylate kinase [Lachnospiraceae bacterium]MDD5853471.1 guanylate kinase [Lachnospiraceae bacterium]
MGKIFYLMGKSSSGKDTIYNQLIHKDSLQLKKIVLYTTRPRRIGETNGVQYYFVDNDSAIRLQKAGKVIEMRSYDTVYGEWKYFTVCDDQIDLLNNDYLMIGTIESYLRTKEYFGTDQVVPIMIELDDGIRLQRALDREKCEPKPRYEEMCRRFLADSVDFSQDKKKEAGITKEFYNQDLEQCLQEIEAYILANK